MSTQAFAPNHRRLQTTAGVVGFKDAPYAITASVRVRADTRRLFQAVVVPEYLEAWLRIPEEGGSCVVSPLDESGGFTLGWRNANAMQARIVAAYKTCRRRRLIICWRLEKDRFLKESTVVMRLSGDFGCSILSVNHSGLGTFDDLAWHRELWSLSLERLAKLF